MQNIFTVQLSIDFSFSQVNGTKESHTLIKVQQTWTIQSIKGASSPFLIKNELVIISALKNWKPLLDRANDTFHMCADISSSSSFLNLCC